MLPALENLTSAFFDAYVEADETNEAANTLSKNKMPEWARGAALAFAILADSVIFALKTISALDKAFGAVGDNVDYRSAQIKRFALSMTAPLIGDPSPELQKKLDDLDKKIFNLGMTALDSTNLVNDLFGDAANMTFSNMLRKSIDSNTVDISQNPTRPTRPAFSGESSKEQDSINKKINERLKAVKKIVGEYAREQDYQLELMDIQNQMLGMTNNQREIQESINNVLTATSEKLQKIAEQRLQAADTGANQTILDQFDQQSDAVQELSDKYVALARAQTESSIDAQMTFSYGWNTAFAQFAEDAQNYASVAADMFGSLVNNMNSAIDKFVDNGKLSFSDFAESVIKDIIKIQLKMQASQLLQMGIGFVMSAFSAGAGGATAFGPGSTAGGAGALSFPVRANGGTITGPSIVGERGAELFVPGRSGAIIPNNNLNDSMGGGGVTYNGPVIQNMQAIDTQSGIQFLAKNKMTIWSMNQSANRSIPAGR
jgi:lambda family phage tail tape measure protein